MPFGPARPPVTEDVAEVIAKDIKSGEGRGLTSEVPLAFQTGAHAPVDPAVVSRTRKQMIILAGVVLAAIVVLLLVSMSS